MRIAIGSDHVGWTLKNALKEHLRASGHEVVDVGPEEVHRCDYPLYGYRAAMLVKERTCSLGVLVCGTGVGISLAANKIPGIRAVVCSESYTARMARMHNDANIVAVGARVVGEAVAEQIVDAFLSAHYEDGRHQQRLEMLGQIEKGQFEG